MPSNETVKISDQVMTEIKSGQLKMKPRWYFVVGSVATTLGFIGLGIMTIFLVSLISFSLRAHGPMGSVRYEQLLSDFPWWVLLITIVGLSFGVWFLKRYDFSYKKNFYLVMIYVIIFIILMGWLINFLGIDNLWIKRGPMRGFYRHYNSSLLRPVSSYHSSDDFIKAV